MSGWNLPPGVSVHDIPGNETEETTARLVVCAAMRNESGLLICGARHHDAPMNGVIKALRNAGDVAPHQWEQGFIDNKGVFMTREEAWSVANAAGQIRRRCGGDTANGGTLFSENLY